MNEKMKPTEAELEILHVLWAIGEASVRQVNERLNEIKDPSVGYTTTLKTMQVMHEKGFLIRNEDNRTHIYAPHSPREDMEKQLVNHFVESAFKGSAMRLVMQALGNHSTSNDELAQIKDLINKIESADNLKP